MATTRDDDWRRFEEAVAAFLAALDPKARVIHDVRLPDRHTGRPRQRDVVVEARLGGHLALKILVSCKRHRRRLSSSDIDAFNGELLSSGAHKGVIYSRSGFSGPALEKARHLGISCCKLFQNEPPQLPSEILLPTCCLLPRLGLELLGNASAWGFVRWGDVLTHPHRDSRVVDVLANELSSPAKPSKPDSELRVECVLAHSK